MLRTLWEKATTQAIIAIGLTAGVIALAFLGKVEPGDLVKGWMVAMTFFFAVDAATRKR